ncbi:hypothetical protein ONS96_010917 [Cadophora gregata f. sp. sojae]|nr:hypothetical protein ONS96_010917 [Cadophora gregata f. sp. sojae]
MTNCMCYSLRKTEAFECLLSAMYNRPYSPSTVADLNTIIQLAEFYRALPILSATMTPALLKSAMFNSRNAMCRFLNLSREVIQVAKQLRNTDLFRECFVHEVGKYDAGDETNHLLDDDIHQLIRREHSVICKRIMRTQSRLLLRYQRFPIWISPDMAMVIDLEDNPTRTADFFRAVKCQVDSLSVTTRWAGGHLDPYMKMAKSELDGLMRNNLRLDRTNFGSASDHNDDYFLCADIKDDEMPWDSDVIDW